MVDLLAVWNNVLLHTIDIWQFCLVLQHQLLKYLHSDQIMELHIVIFYFVHLSATYVGVALNLFPVDGPKSWWSLGTWNRSHVQDRQEQVWVNCKKLDPEICHGIINLCMWGRAFLTLSVGLTALVWIFVVLI